MTQPTLDEFFGGGGGKSFSWKDKPTGTSITGTIKMVHEARQVTDPADNKPQFNKRGEPKMQVRIDMATKERDPEDPDDDGSRGLYVGGWMKGAIAEAVRKAGQTGAPKAGGQLTVTLTERTPNDVPGLNPINKFSAQYTPPSSVATERFFSGDIPGTVSSAGISNGEPERPASIDAAAWAAMDASTKQAIANTMSALPPF